MANILKQLEKKRSNTILTDSVLDKMSHSELKHIIKSTHANFSPSTSVSSYEKLELKILSKEISRKKKILSQYNDFFSKVSLNPNLITSEKLLFEDFNNLTLKKIFEFQNNKILFQQLKIRELESGRYGKTLSKKNSSESVSSISTKYTFEKCNNDLSEKINEAFNKKENIVEGENYLYINSFYKPSIEEIDQNKEKLRNEVRKKLENLNEKYGRNVFSYIINKRMKDDCEYKKIFKEIENEVNEKAVFVKKKKEVEKYFEEKSKTNEFREGKTKFTVFSQQELIKNNQKFRANHNFKNIIYESDSESGTIEISINWDN